MVSALRRRKYAALFACFDLNHDRFLEKADYEQFARNLQQAYGLAENSPAYAALYTETMEIWAFVRTLADQDGDNRVTQEEFVTAVAALTENEAAYQQLVESYGDYVFRTGNRNGDGNLSEAEYTTLHKCYGGSDQTGQEAFRRMDTDGSGSLSVAELQKACDEFFRSEDENAPGNWLVGPF